MEDLFNSVALFDLTFFIDNDLHNNSVCNERVHIKFNIFYEIRSSFNFNNLSSS